MFLLLIVKYFQLLFLILKNPMTNLVWSIRSDIVLVFRQSDSSISIVERIDIDPLPVFVRLVGRAIVLREVHRVGLKLQF